MGNLGFNDGMQGQRYKVAMPKTTPEKKKKKLMFDYLKISKEGGDYWDPKNETK